MGKTALMVLVMLALSAIAISGQGQTYQSTAPATTTTTTTTGSTLGPTTTATTTDMTLYEGGPSVLPSGKAHIKITKHSDADLNEYIYKIYIEDDPKQSGFTPTSIVATFSVDDNVYIKYDEIKTEYSFYDVEAKKRNYAIYKLDPCGEKTREFVNDLASYTAPGLIHNIYDTLETTSKTFECWTNIYDWRADISVNGYNVDTSKEYRYENFDRKSIMDEIIGETEEERNNRRVETIAYSNDAISNPTILPRSVVITIPVRPKDRTVESDIKMWIDVRGSWSTGEEGQIDTVSQVQNIVASVPQYIFGIYFENKNMFQMVPPKSSDVPTDEDLHPPILSGAKVVPDCGQEKSDEFNFSVIYKDEADPVETNIAIRGWAFDSTRTVYNSDYNDMTKVSGEAKHGSVYSFKTQLPEKGEYNYTFYFKNSKGVTVRLPEKGFEDNYGLPGPEVGIDCKTSEKDSAILFLKIKEITNNGKTCSSGPVKWEVMENGEYIDYTTSCAEGWGSRTLQVGFGQTVNDLSCTLDNIPLPTDGYYKTRFSWCGESEDFIVMDSIQQHK